VAVFPVSNLVIPIGVLLAERTLYLPSVGLAIAVLMYRGQQITDPNEMGLMKW